MTQRRVYPLLAFIGAFLIATTRVGLLWAAVATLSGIALVILVAMILRARDARVGRVERSAWLLSAGGTVKVDSASVVPGRLRLSAEHLAWSPSSEKRGPTIEVDVKDIVSTSIASASALGLTTSFAVTMCDHRQFKFVVNKKPAEVRRIWQMVSSQSE